jgi:hypothetical protein
MLLVFLRPKAISGEVLMKITFVSLVSLFALFPIGVSAEGAVSRFPASTTGDNPVVLVGAGDIADCSDLSGAEATAKLIAQIQGTVMAIGDLAPRFLTACHFSLCEWRVDGKTVMAKTPGRIRSTKAPREFSTLFFEAFNGEQPAIAQEQR